MRVSLDKSSKETKDAKTDCQGVGVERPVAKRPIFDDPDPGRIVKTAHVAADKVELMVSVLVSLRETTYKVNDNTANWLSAAVAHATHQRSC